MARLLRRGSFAFAIGSGIAVALLAGCHGWPLHEHMDAGADAADADAGFDANLPDTVVVYLEAGTEPDGKPTRVQDEATVPVMALPRPCADKTLGNVVFTQDGSKVQITSSKGVASATCVRMDEHKLLCDWLDKDGRPTVTRRAVSYGPKTKIAGTYDGKHAFSCPVQTDPVAPAPPKLPNKKGGAAPRH